MSATPANDPFRPLAALVAEAVQEALDKRMPSLAALGLVPPRFVLPHVAALVLGYTEKAIQQKIDAGVWLEGKQWKRAPDGRRFIDLQGVEAWVAGEPK